MRATTCFTHRSKAIGCLEFAAARQVEVRQGYHPGDLKSEGRPKRVVSIAFSLDENEEGI